MIPLSARAGDPAKANSSIHRFSTLITAQQVRDLLGSEDGISAAIDWCEKTAVTKVYLEAFRSGYRARRETLQHAKERFLAAGLDVSGCVTTTIVGKKSTGWNIISCYTNPITGRCTTSPLEVRLHRIRCQPRAVAG